MPSAEEVKASMDLVERLAEKFHESFRSKEVIAPKWELLPLAYKRAVYAGVRTVLEELDKIGAEHG